MKVRLASSQAEGSASACSPEPAPHALSELNLRLRQERDALEQQFNERTQALALSEARLRSLLSLSADWIWEQDAELRYTYVSEGFGAVVGHLPRLLGKRHVFGDTLEADPEARAHYESSVAARRAYRDFTYAIVRPDGVRRWIRVSGEPVFDATGSFSGYRGVGRDVTDIVTAQQQAEALARFDHLTGLPNRRWFLLELDRAVARARRSGQGFALCFIDLDRFKSVNDTMGHLAGDDLLAQVGSRLKGMLRGADLVARLGGDEFVLLLEGTVDPADLNRLAGTLLTTLNQPFTVSGQDLQLSASLGIARFPLDGDDATTLLSHADSAMYDAKAAGENRAHFYTPEAAAQAARLFTLETELRLAIARREFELHYQPKMRIGDEAVLAVEALLRWNHPVRGTVGPAEFIALAEERGLIVELGRLALEDACSQIARWRGQGLRPPSVALNVSARQFADESLVADLKAAMARHGVSGDAIEVELTETVLMANPQKATRVLQALRGMGIRISIDDFGTGYSSLSYLKRFPADEVKIDRSFVRGLPADADDMAITQAVIAMAHSLGLVVVAEGVETPEQLDSLAHMGCDMVQGYLLGRPMPAAALAQRLPRLQLATSGVVAP